MKKLKSLLALALIMFVFASGKAGSERPMHEIHSMMIFNFLKYVQWPGYEPSQDFVIGVIGNDDVAKTLDLWYNNKVRGNKKFVVKKFNSPSEVTGCHVLYLGKNAVSGFDTVMGKLAGYPALTISDGPGLAKKGSSINFRTNNGKLVFEMNQKAIDNANLKVSSQLAAMAIMV